MRKKQKNVGKRLSIFTIMLAFIAAGMLIFLFNLWLSGRKASTSNHTQIASIDGIKTVDISELYYDNDWAKSSIANVVDDDVPIPVGFEYMQGTKETGVIAKDSTSGQFMLWIPYDSAVTENVDDYYQHCEYNPMDMETQDAIHTYGGFYVTLEKNSQYDLLKQVTNDSYQTAYKKATEIYQDSKSMNSHLIGKTELAQAIAYSKKIGLNVSQTSNNNSSYQISMTANTTGNATAEWKLDSALGIVVSTPETYTSSYDDETVAIQLPDETFVVKPRGFSLCKTNDAAGDTNNVNSEGSSEVVKIKDIKNSNLVYIWVPVSKKELTNALDEIKKLYANQDVPFDFETVTTLDNDQYQELLQSVETYSGFYIAQAELGYDTTGNPVNRARGMKIDETNENKWSGVYDGNYYRGTEFKTYDQAVEKASNLHSDNNAVTSHLMYGVEWDATMLWLLNGGNVSKEQLIKNSGSVPGAKYKDTIVLDSNGALEDSSLLGSNCIYGLAGNLFELTQETVKVDNGTYRSIRGGSFLYNSSDDAVAMASRIELLENEIELGTDIGFRNCLYLNPEAIKNEKYFQITNDGEISVREEYKSGGERENELLSATIPSSLNGIQVISIAEDGFKDCIKMRKVILPDTITNIKKGAFQGCTALTEIEMSKNITGIASDAFDGCKVLETITIPEKCETIYSNALKDCKKLREVIFKSNGKITISKEAFSGKTKNINTLSFHAIPQEISIDKHAFVEVGEIKTLNVPQDMSEDMINGILALLGINRNNIAINRLVIEKEPTEEEQLSEYRDSVYNDYVENYIQEHYSDRANEEWIVKEKESVKKVINALTDEAQIKEAAIHFQEYIEYNKNQNGIKLISHRGNSDAAPENTLEGFKLAKENGFYYVETDVKFTKDGVPILMHDDTLERLTNGSGAVKDLTLEEIKQLRFKNTKTGYGDVTIPTFEEFIKLCHETGLHPYIEIKETEDINRQQAQVLYDIVEKENMIYNVTWIADRCNSLKEIKEVYRSHSTIQNLRLGHVVYGSFEDGSEDWRIDAAKQLQEDNVSVFMDMNQGYYTATANEKIVNSGLDIELWTALDHNKIQELLKKNTKGITTNVTKI